MKTSRIETVPLSDLDRRILHIYGSRGSWSESLWSAITCTMMVAVFIYFAIKISWRWAAPLADPSAHPYSIATVAFVLGAWLCRDVWAYFVRDLKPSHAPNDFDLDLINGEACCLTIGVNRAVEIAEYEDEGAGFFLELEDGRVLSLVSQDLYEFAHDFEYEEGEEDKSDKFPQTMIEYRYAPLSGLALECKGVGEALKPMGLVKTEKHHFPKNRETKHLEFIGASDGTFYDGSLEEVLSRLKYKLTPL